MLEQTSDHPLACALHTFWGAHAPSRVPIGASPMGPASDNPTPWCVQSVQSCGKAPQAARGARALPENICNTSRLVAALCLLFGIAGMECLQAAKVVVIGDSLSAEYEMIPDFPGTDNPTEYARITVDGWESMSWVEVLARLRGDFFDFGGFRAGLFGWADLRFSGYEFNFAIPGFRAAQYEDIVNSSLFSNPQYLPFRATLQDVLKNEAERVVIWVGANEFRANYGSLAGGISASSLIANLTRDLEAVIDFVRGQRSGLQIVVANIPDLGAAPDKRKAHPDPAQRALVTAATKQANAAIAALAASRGIAVADVFAQTERLIEGVTTFFGAVDIINDTHPDNNPRYQFTRDGLHPNTPSQLEIARVMIEAFNAAFQAGIPNITDAEALKFLHLRPDQPYLDWIEGFAVSEKRMEDDPDRDGLSNIVELAFGLDPSASNPSPVTWRVEAGRLTATFRPNQKYRRLTQVLPQRTLDLRVWTDLPNAGVISNPDGSQTAGIPITGTAGFVRLGVMLNSPQ